MKKTIQNKTKSKVTANRKKAFSTNPKQELKKVTWPNRNTLLKSTILIIAISIILTFYVAGLDLAFSKLFYLLREII